MRTRENAYLAIHVETPSHSDALSGLIPGGKNPGLKAWAVLLNRYALSPTDSWAIPRSPLRR